MKFQIASAVFALSAVANALPGGQSACLGEYKGHSYTVYYGCYETSLCKAEEFCKCQGGYLAEVAGAQEVSFLSCALKDKAPCVSSAYIESWNGDDYCDSGIAFYQGGAIAPAFKGNKGPLAFICESDCKVSSGKVGKVGKNKKQK